jgi:hypothetical protein
MNTTTIDRRVPEDTLPIQKAKSILLLAGAFTFAFLLGEMVHEFGHYLTHLAYGNTGVGIHLDPFGGSRIVGVTSLPLNVMGVTSAAGPLFNLALGTTCSLLLWRKHRPGLLPLLLWGPVAMVQEGVTFSLGLLTPGGDAQWVVAAGIPMAVVLTVGIGLLLTGIVMTSWQLSRVIFDQDIPFGGKFLVVLVGISSLMLVRAIHATMAAPALAIENLVPLIFSVLLSSIVVLVQGPLASGLHNASETPRRISWSSVASTIALGMAMFLFQVVI